MNRTAALLLSLSACGPGLTALGPDRAAVQPSDEVPSGTDTTAPADTTGSGGNGAGATEDPTDNQDLGPVIRVTAVDPWYGSDAGGSQVTIVGTGFTDGVEVTFNRVPATVVSVTTTAIEVVVPENIGEEWVDVQVIKGARGDLLTSGFQYWADAFGLTGGFLTLERVRQVGGYWVSPANPVAWATLSFFTPLDIGFRDMFAESMNGCSNNYGGPAGFMQYTVNTPSITLRSGASTWELTPDPADPDFFASAYRPATQVAVTDAWGLDPLQAADFPGFGTPQTVEGVATFNVTSPAIDRASMPMVNRSFDVEWSGNGGNYVIIMLTHYAYNVQGSAVAQQRVTCVADDTGSFTVPRDAWTRWKGAPDDYLEVQIGRVTESSWAMPHDHSGLNGVGVAWVLGAAGMN